MEFRILQRRDINPDLELGITRLMHQLNPNLKPLELSALMAEANDLYILCAFERRQLLGMASLAIYRVLSGKKGMIEDVVVDDKHRRKGVAKKLMEELIRLSRKLDIDQLLLYTGAHRKPAQQLYEVCGFTKKSSFQYILYLG